jgi:hypothetical protein
MDTTIGPRSSHAPCGDVRRSFVTGAQHRNAQRRFGRDAIDRDGGGASRADRGHAFAGHEARKRAALLIPERDQMLGTFRSAFRDDFRAHGDAAA